MVNFSNQTGRSMIEIIGVLAIIGVLSVGALAGYSAAMEKNKANKIVDEVSNLVANIHSIYPNSDYKDISLEHLVKLNAVVFVPANAKITSVRMTNRLGGYLMLEAAYTPEAELYNKYNDYHKTRTINVIYTGMTESLCNKIATYDWTDPNLVGMMIGADSRITGSIANDCLKTTPVDKNGNLKNEDQCFAAVHDTNGIPITPSKAATACNLCAQTSNCFVAWKFR